LDKAKFNPKISLFFSNYLIGRKIQYLWNNFLSPFFNVNISIGQGSTLFPILSVLYLSPIFHIFKKRAKSLKIPVLFVFFVDNGLFVLQEKTLDKLKSLLFYSYNVMFSLLDQFSLIIEHGKTEFFHFSKSYRIFNPFFLDLSHFGGFILHSKDT